MMQTNCAVYPHRPDTRGRLEAHPRGLGRQDQISVTDRSLIWNSDLVETLEFENLILQAVVTMDGAAVAAPKAAAPMRARIIPNRDDENWMKHTLAWIDADAGTTSIDYRPVHTYTMTNEMQYIEPKARVY